MKPLMMLFNLLSFYRQIIPATEILPLASVTPSVLIFSVGVAYALFLKNP
jgi:hypothetical protein